MYITSSGRERDPQINVGPWRSGSWYNLKSDVKGTHVKIYVNDKLVHEITMSGNGADAKEDNYVGLWCHNNMHIKGDSFNVQGREAEERLKIVKHLHAGGSVAEWVGF